MQSVKSIEKNISTYKIALKAAKSDALKKKLRDKIAAAEQEIDKLQSKKTKKSTSTPNKKGVSMTNAKRFAEAKKRRSQQALTTKKDDIEKDANRPALPKGFRISKNGNKYWEGRENRIDRRPARYARLEDGGMMAKGGVTFKDKVASIGGELGVDRHRIYFSSFAEVMDGIEDIAEDNGYKVVSIFPDLSLGGVSYGQTKRAQVELEWNGEEKRGKSKKRENNVLNVQIYRMESGNYELNTYFSYASGGMMAKGGLIEHGLQFGDLILGMNSSSEAKIKNIYDNQMYIVDISKGQRTPAMEGGGELHRMNESMM